MLPLMLCKELESGANETLIPYPPPRLSKPMRISRRLSDCLKYLLGKELLTASVIDLPHERSSKNRARADGFSEGLLN